MQRIHPARRVFAIVAAAAACALASLALAATSASAGAPVTVRVEGPSSTLVPATSVTLSDTAIVKNGVAADSCSGNSAAGALQLATHGNWAGTWSASYHSYFLTAIDGVSYPSTGAEYWAFWVNDAPASDGICEYHPKPGDSILFFPACYGKKCPKATGVLAIKAAAVATVGRSLPVSVTAYNETSGKPAAAAAVTLSGGGASARTTAAGTASLSFAHAGRFTLSASKPGAIRAEAKICVEAAGAKTCG